MNGSTNTLHVRRRRQTRSEIVRAAFELFAKQGYEAVSMDSIAEAAGVSRATLFNYFPQKELMLRDIAAARAEKLKSILGEFSSSRKPPKFDDIVALFLRLSEENARIAGHSKKLLLETFFRSASQGLLLAAREEAITALAASMGKIVRGRKQARLAAETLFAVFLATMLEWLMREDAPAQWLMETMRARLLTLREGIA
jgi:AcrR family transcriptional regulator